MSLSRTQIVNWLTRCGDIFSTESEYLTGLDREIGSLACGKQADILVLDRKLSLRNIVLNGELQAVLGFHKLNL